MVDRFVDTRGWAAWVNDPDVFHSKAQAAVEYVWQSNGRLVTTNLVLIELTALLIRMRIDKPRQIHFFDELFANPSVLVIDIDSKRDADAWLLCRSRLDKAWTMVDCASFGAMKDMGIREAVTNDHHFEQAGFVRLLR
jgi:predicted nucleic acid-binding protein